MNSSHVKTRCHPVSPPPASSASHQRAGCSCARLLVPRGRPRICRHATQPRRTQQKPGWGLFPALRAGTLLRSSPEGAVPNELCLHWTAETTSLLPAGPANLKDRSCFPLSSHAQWNHAGIWGHEECAVLTLKTQREHLLKKQRSCIGTKKKEVWGEWKK